MSCRGDEEKLHPEDNIVILGLILKGCNTGMGSYVQNIVENIGYLSKGISIFVDFKLEKKPLYNIEILTVNKPKVISNLYGFNTLWNFIILPLKLRHYSNIKIIHDPSTLAIFAIIDLPYKKIVTIHDIAPIVQHDLWPKYQVIQHRLFLPRVIKRANVILTASEFSKNEICNYFNINPNKVEVVYQSCNDIYRIVDNKKMAKRVLEKLGIKNVYILNVGTSHRQKNRPGLIRAFSKIQNKDIDLVIIGTNIQGGDNSLSELVSDLGLEDRVHFLGYIPNEDLVYLYNEAEIFVFPSLYEGFGIPVLEAMSCGVPVITSNISSLPEVAGNAALLIDPYSENQLVSAINELLSSHSLRDEYKIKGLQQAKEFSNKMFAKKILKVYRDLLDN